MPISFIYIHTHLNYFQCTWNNYHNVFQTCTFPIIPSVSLNTYMQRKRGILTIYTL